MRKIEFLFLAISVLIGSCKQPRQNEQVSQDSKLKITATTGMVADMVRNIGGNHVEVVALMGPGVDPHLYKATQNDLNHLRNADLVVYNGLHLEGKMTDILEKFSAQKPVYALSSTIDPSLLIALNDQNNLHDPHIWFDVKLWLSTVDGLSKEMTELNPSYGIDFNENAKNYKDSLMALNDWVAAQMMNIPAKKRVLITAHDAFGYFGKSYQVEVKALQGVSTLSEFGLKDVSELVDFISHREIKSVFVESSIPRKSLEAVVAGCREKGHEVAIGGTLYSDALGSEGTPESTYIGMVRTNVHTISKGLN